MIRAAEATLKRTYQTPRVPAKKRQKNQIVNEEKGKKRSAQLQTDEVLEQHHRGRAEQALPECVNENYRGPCRIQVLIYSLHRSKSYPDQHAKKQQQEMRLEMQEKRQFHTQVCAGMIRRLKCDQCQQSIGDGKEQLNSLPVVCKHEKPQ
jgi:hypothetical protein